MDSVEDGVQYSSSSGKIGQHTGTCLSDLALLVVKSDSFAVPIALGSAMREHRSGGDGG